MLVYNFVMLISFSKLIPKIVFKPDISQDGP
jgi:hypothetical protein